MSAPRTILITAASGNIGRELIPLLASKPDITLILPTRSAARLHQNLPSLTTTDASLTTPNLAIITPEGDLSDPHWFQSLLTSHAVDTVFLCLHGAFSSELDITLNALDAMARAGCVKQCVYVSICGDFVSPQGIEKLTRNCSAGHMLVKIPIELKLKHGGYPFATTVLGPTLFFTNDYRCKTGLMKKEGEACFDEPVDRTSRVSTRDIAQVARNVIFPRPGQEGKYVGRKLQIGSLHQYSAAETAAIWSTALQKAVKPFGSGQDGAATKADLDMMEVAKEGTWGPSFTRDVRLMYEAFLAMPGGFGMKEEEYGELVDCLGREAEGYEGWVGGVAEEWTRRVSE